MYICHAGFRHIYICIYFVVSTTCKCSWTDSHQLQTKWQPCMDSFFDSLVFVIQGVRSYLLTDQVDSAKFWCHRLDEYEWTLSLLLARVEELSPDRVTFVQLKIWRSSLIQWGISKFFSLYTVYSAETLRSILPVSLLEDFEHQALLKNSPLYLLGSPNLQPNKLLDQGLIPPLQLTTTTRFAHIRQVCDTRTPNCRLGQETSSFLDLAPCMTLTRESRKESVHFGNHCATILFVVDASQFMNTYMWYLPQYMYMSKNCMTYIYIELFANMWRRVWSYL